jgi:hypothetical protein
MQNNGSRLKNLLPFDDDTKKDVKRAVRCEENAYSRPPAAPQLVLIPRPWPNIGPRSEWNIPERNGKS